MSTDNRPEHGSDKTDREDQSGGQVSESAKPDAAMGGADATDKSTGTAPGEATEPDA